MHSFRQSCGRILVLLSFFALLALPVFGQTGPHIPLQEPQLLPVNPAASQSLPQALVNGQGQPLSMSFGDYDQDGIDDLAVGYASSGAGIVAIFSGNVDAFAPQSHASWGAIAANSFPIPFTGVTSTFSTPTRPDFLVSGQFANHGLGLVSAARGDNTLYFFAGDGHGHFAAPQSVALPEMRTVTALAAGRFGPGTAPSSLLVGTNGATGAAPALLLYTGSGNGLSLTASYPLQAPVTAFAFGDLNGDSLTDAVMISGGNLLALYATSAGQPAAAPSSVALSFTATAIATGLFVHDRDPHLQMAILSPDGSVHIVAHRGFDSRGWSSTDLTALRQARLHKSPSPSGHTVYVPGGEGWQEIETFSSVAPFGAGVPPLLLRTRISDHAADDLIVLNSAAGQLSMISHANVPLNAAAFTPGQKSIRAYSAGAPVAATAMHLNAEGRLGVVVLHQGQTAPSTMAPLADFVFTVNTMIDTVDVNPGDGICADSAGRCSLRAAVMESNKAASGGSTIMLPQGVYTLTIPGIDGSDASTGHLDLVDGITIVGENPTTTVIQAGTQVGSNGIPNGIDKVFSINAAAVPGFDANLSNLTIRYGLNVSGLNPFGGAFDWDAGTDGTGTLKITNCRIVNNATVITDSPPLADGGGISLTNEFPGAATTGSVTISDTTITSNIAQDIGGGVFVGGLPMTMSNTQISNNQAIDDPSSQKLGLGGGQQAGGGIFIGGPGVGQIIIQNSTVSGNQAGTQGGGIFTNAGPLISGSTIDSNQAGQSGGGVFSNLVNETAVVTGTNITSNTATGNGGGIEVDSSSQGNNLTIKFSRIAGNKAAAGSGLNNISGSVAATDNWWGCNQGPTAAPCDLLTNAGTASFSPWLVLQNNANPNALSANFTSILTAGFLQDSTGATITADNLGAFAGVPISFQNAINGAITNAQPAIQASGTATATFTGTTPGTGQADAVVDGFHATANVAIADCAGDYILSSALPQTVLAGGTATYALSVNPLSGFNGKVVFQNVIGLPGGATASFSPTSITTSGISTLTIGTTSFTPAGNYSLTVTSACGSKANATGVNLNVQNFTLSATAISQAIPPGSSASSTVSVAAQNGFTGNVSFSVSGLPKGATYSFNPPSLTTSGSSVLTIFTPVSMPAGANVFTINAVSNGLQQSDTAVIVTSGFSLTAAPSSRTVARGATASYQMNAFPIGGFNGPITLNVSGLPSGATFSPVSIPGPEAFTLSIFTTASTPAGASSPVVTGSSGTITAATNIALLATSAAAPAISSIAPAEVLAEGPTFSLAVNGSNFPADAVVRINGLARPTSVVNSGQLIAAIFATDITASSHQDITVFSPSSGVFSDATPLTVFRYGDLNFDNTVNIQDLVLLSNLISGNLPGFDTTPADVYQDGVIDTADLTTLANFIAGNIHHLPVTPVGDFLISASSASQSVTAGSNSSLTISTADFDGFIGTVKLSITGLPAGATASFAPTSIAGNGSSTLTISTSSAPAGNYALTITGTSGSRVHSTGLTLSITAVDQPPPPPPPDPCNPNTGVVMGSLCPVLQIDN